MNHFLRSSPIVIAFFCISIVNAQEASPTAEPIAVLGRPFGDSIVLRWAPRSLEVWQLGNTVGYRVERYTLSRNGKVLDNPEKKILDKWPVKPSPQTDWIQMVKTDKYAAIAAQALFGDSFEIDLGKSGVAQIVNKVKENEQRFSFALLCADMSPDVAKLSGLRFVDKTVEHNAKYLYRIIIVGRDSTRGSLFIGPDDSYKLPPPNNVRGDAGAHTVTIRWDKPIGNIYTAFTLEKSADGFNYSQVGSDPLVTLESEGEARGRYEYASDSLMDDSAWYYRVRGITAFGEKGDPSDSIRIKARPEVTSVPQIVDGQNVQNQFIDLRWEFDKKQENGITGFTIERSSTPRDGEIATLATNLTPQTRSYRDQSPDQTNYYRVVAMDNEGNRIPSPIYYAELIDSIPPSDPSGLTGKIDGNGVVRLTWRTNPEKDMDGYRVYRANFESEEPFQVTTDLVKTANFSDSVDLHTLDKAVYYCIMAVDINQNHSGLSQKLRLVLPDKTPPQPPEFLPVTNSETGISLEWTTGASNDVKLFRVYRNDVDSSKWVLVAQVQNAGDSLHHWSDEDAAEGARNVYTVTALDEAGNESEPAVPIAAMRLINHHLNSVEWKDFDLDKIQHQVTLRWESEVGQVIGYRLYRSIDGSPWVLFRTLSPESAEFSDHVIPGKGYQYRISALLTKGRQTKLSEPVTVKY